MHTFAPKPKDLQQRTVAAPALPALRYSAPGLDLSSLPQLQRTIGNQAVQRLLQARSSLPIQPKLTVNPPGDPYEQEADRISEQVMRMPDTRLQRTCSCDGECPECESKAAGQEHGRLQAQRLPASGTGPDEAPPIVHEVLAEPGQPLDTAAREFMEPRFGQDFSHVRVHTGARAEESAEAVSARAYTAGRDVVFGAGEYQPHTAAGRQLLAHELSHTIQQGAAGPPALQRAIKLELQTSNTVKTSRGRNLGRKSGGYLHKGATGIRLEVDTGGVVEFETGGWERTWSTLRDMIQEAVDITKKLNRLGGKGFPFSEQRRLRKEGVLTKRETLEVAISDATFGAAIQSSEGIALPQYESLLKEHETVAESGAVITGADNVLAAGAASAGVTLASPDNLRGFLQMIVAYIRSGQSVLFQVSDGTWDPPKTTFQLMVRTDFSSIFKTLLNKDEQAVFRQIVKDGTIEAELGGLSPADPLFKTGYWGHYAGMMALFDGGKIVALGNKNNNYVIHDCATTATLTPAEKKRLKADEGIDVKQCGKTDPATNITISAWLNSIIHPGKKKADLLSHPARGSAAMGGEGDVRKKGKSKGLVLFETRASARRNWNQPADKWVEFAEEIFLMAATCRPRTGKTELKYDGTKILDPTLCP